MELKDIIKQLKEKTGYNNATIARLLGVSKPTVGRWVDGDVYHLKEETAGKLSELLGYDVTKVLNNDLVCFKKPILGMVKAGYDLFLDSNYLGESEVTYDEYNNGDFFLEVVGDSMIGDGIVDGSLIYVRKSSNIQSGKIAVVQVGDEVTVKRVIIKDDTLILEASNPSVKNRYFSKKEVMELPVKIIGSVLYSKTEF